MSAYVVGYDHIDALITYAIKHQVAYRANGTCNWISKDNATEVGKILLAENERSVRYRYPNEYELPGTIGEDATGYEFKPFNEPLEFLMILKACDGLEYQCCETEDYPESVAANIINAIRKVQIARLPGYSEAPGWSLERSYSVR